MLICWKQPQSRCFSRFCISVWFCFFSIISLNKVANTKTQREEYKSFGNGSCYKPKSLLAVTAFPPEKVQVSLNFPSFGYTFTLDKRKQQQQNKTNKPTAPQPNHRHKNHNQITLCIQRPQLTPNPEVLTANPAPLPVGSHILEWFGAHDLICIGNLPPPIALQSCYLSQRYHMPVYCEQGAVMAHDLLHAWLKVSYLW